LRSLPDLLRRRQDGVRRTLTIQGESYRLKEKRKAGMIAGDAKARSSVAAEQGAE
jgi:hypothetical protein